MNDLKICCDGLMMGSLVIPPFQLRQGEVLCIIWPLYVDDPVGEEFINILTGRKSCPAVHVAERVDRATAPWFRRTIFGSARMGDLVYKVVPAKLKYSVSQKGFWGYKMMQGKQLSSIPTQRREEVLGKLNLASDIPLSNLPADLRALFGLEIAWAEANVVVFDTVGCDPLGIETIYNSVAKHLEHGAAMEISYASINRLAPNDYCYPDARRVEIRGWENYRQHQEPSRQQVEAKLVDFIEGRYSREEVAAWANHWVNMFASSEDRVAWKSLNALAGATIKGRDQEYIHPDSAYRRWLEELRRGQV